MKPKIQYLTLLLFSAITLNAQDSKDDPQVSMTIDFVSWGEDLTGLEVRSGKSGKPVKALGFRYSEPFTYSGSQILTLGWGEVSDEVALERAEALKQMQEEIRRDAKAEGVDLPSDFFAPKVNPAVKGEISKTLTLAREKDPTLAALVKLPANSRRVTILLAPGPQRSLVPHIFDDDPTRHPLGMVRVHNISLHSIQLQTASTKGKQIELEPGKSFFAAAQAETFAYELAYKADDVWKVQENNMITVRPNEQMHMCILRSEASFFTSSDGSRGGFMQVVFLRRTSE